jgi:hypothetical protein
LTTGLRQLHAQLAHAWLGREQMVAGTGWRILRFIDDGSPRYAVVLERE